jgi:hypothetical protein
MFCLKNVKGDKTQYFVFDMLPLGTKQSGGKLLPHSDFRGRVFLREISSSRSHFYKKDYKGNVELEEDGKDQLD